MAVIIHHARNPVVDTLSIHSKSIKGNLTCITLGHHHIIQSLIPGRKICFECIRKMKSEKEVKALKDPDYVPQVFRLHQQQATTPTRAQSRIRTQNLKVLSTNRHHCATGAAKVMSSRLSWLQLLPKSVTLFIVSY
jgi:hypothetical protein